jgi:hypothetical protein
VAVDGDLEVAGGGHAGEATSHQRVGRVRRCD